YEPYLMRLGFISRTSRGRILTDLGIRHLKGISNVQTLL
ncbi:MAG: Holliday junction DNA helicase RuvB C-terminal domain-containing protein, partial [bacterium]|nr:Holliday junction DNA helicase RuvB C-terminal domain-containing protein [bacterium]